MSERERWIVYPLLFLALGAALRDKLIKQTVADKVFGKEIYCETLTVETLTAIDDQGKPVAALNGGNLALNRIDAKQVNATNLVNQARAQAADSLNWKVLTDLLRRAGLPIAPARRPPTPIKPPPPPTPPAAAANEADEA